MRLSPILERDVGRNYAPRLGKIPYFFVFCFFKPFANPLQTLPQGPLLTIRKLV